LTTCGGTMKNSWICRDYQTGDENQILALNNEFNDRKITLEHWKWKFIETPFGKAIIKLMFDGEKLIGHRGAMPMVVSIQDRDFPSAQIVNTLTHPDYRRLGISTHLAQAICEAAKEQRIKFIYNFPNPDSYPLYLKIDGWQMLDQRNAWQKKLPTKSTSTMLRSRAIKEIERFDHRVDRLWDRVKQDYVVVVPRTAKFLNWRFTQHPTEEYSKFVVEDNSGEISGYLVLKVYRRGDEVKGHIIDMLCLNNENIVKSLLDYSYNFFIEKGIRNLTCWMPESSFYTSLLKKEGFATEMMETHCGLWILDKQEKLVDTATDIKNWHITMGDSDVF